MSEIHHSFSSSTCCFPFLPEPFCLKAIRGEDEVGVPSGDLGGPEHCIQALEGEG